jgi:hypothetical protein
VPQASLAPVPSHATVHERPSVARAQPRQSRPSRASRPSATPRRKKGNRWLLVVVGVLAGAISAAIAIAALKFLESREPKDDGEEVEAQNAPPPPAEVLPAAETDAGTDAGAPPDAGELPEGAEVPPEVDTEPEDEEDDRNRRNGSMRTTMRDRNNRDTAMGGEPSSPSEMLREARAALARGDTSRCLELVDRALESGGGSTALRLQGDCYLRANNRSEAVKAYERFCRLAPDHPAIEEVRRLTESLGGRCP